MNTFSQFGITTTQQALQGEKIRIDKVLNREITVEDFRIVDSKFEGKGKRLDLQITLNDEKRVVFTGSTVLMDMIGKVPKDGFPFKATIVKEMEWYKFT